MATCKHLNELGDRVENVTPKSDGCEECLASGSSWVHLRMCLECGHVGCCDSSEGRHATKHFEAVKHPVMRSAQVGENWGWCYVDKLQLDIA